MDVGLAADRRTVASCSLIASPRESCRPRELFPLHEIVPQSSWLVACVLTAPRASCLNFWPEAACTLDRSSNVGMKYVRMVARSLFTKRTLLMADFRKTALRGSRPNQLNRLYGSKKCSTREELANSIEPISRSPTCQNCIIPSTRCRIIVRIEN